MYVMHPFSLSAQEAWRAQISKRIRTCVLLLETVLRARHEGKVVFDSLSYKLLPISSSLLTAHPNFLHTWDMVYPLYPMSSSQAQFNHWDPTVQCKPSIHQWTISLLQQEFLTLLSVLKRSFTLRGTQGCSQECW